MEGSCTTPPPPRSNFSVPRAAPLARERAGAGSAGGQAAPAQRSSLWTAVTSGEAASRRAEAEQKALALRYLPSKALAEALGISLWAAFLPPLLCFPPMPRRKVSGWRPMYTLPRFPSLRTAGAADFHLGKFFFVLFFLPSPSFLLS